MNTRTNPILILDSITKPGTGSAGAADVQGAVAHVGRQRSDRAHIAGAGLDRCGEDLLLVGDDASSKVILASSTNNQAQGGEIATINEPTQGDVIDANLSADGSALVYLGVGGEISYGETSTYLDSSSLDQISTRATAIDAADTGFIDNLNMLGRFILAFGMLICLTQSTNLGVFIKAKNLQFVGGAGHHCAASC